MRKTLTIKEYDRAADHIRRRIHSTPRIAMILGSGLGALADSIEECVALPYDEIPGWPPVTVRGHAGRLLVGRLENIPVAVMQGRVHYYEGYEIDETTFPVRVFQRLGVGSLIITNAAGAVNPDYQPGDLMLISDHINMIGMGGNNPLRGPNDDSLGTRFPGMTRSYDPKYRELVRECAQDDGRPLREGVYVCVAGPSFETPAELRFLRAIGADAVGMSTVPEVIVARHAGMRVLGISGITNKANLNLAPETDHETVLAAGRYLVPALERLVARFLRRLDGS